MHTVAARYKKPKASSSNPRHVVEV